MPENELKRKFGAYVKVAILNARKQYLMEQDKINHTEISLDTIENLKDERAEQILDKPSYLDCEIRNCDMLKIEEIIRDIDDPVINSLVSSLRDKPKKVLMLRVIYNKSFQEIGKMLEISASQSKNIYYNTIAKMRKNIGG